MKSDSELRAAAKRLNLRVDADDSERTVALGILYALDVDVEHAWNPGTDPRPACSREDAYLIGAAISEAKSASKEAIARAAMRERSRSAFMRGDAQTPGAAAEVDPDDLAHREATGETYAMPPAANKAELLASLGRWFSFKFQTPIEKAFAKKWLEQRCADFGVAVPKLDGEKFDPNRLPRTKTEVEDVLKRWGTYQFASEGEKSMARQWLTGQCAALHMPIPKLDGADVPRGRERERQAQERLKERSATAHERTK